MGCAVVAQGHGSQLRSSELRACPVTRFRKAVSMSSMPRCSRFRLTVRATTQKVVKDTARKQVTKVVTRNPKDLTPKPPSPSPDPKDPLTPSWGFLDLQAYNQPWQVNWGLSSVAVGMGAWALSFVGLGLFAMPKLFIAFGVDLREGGPSVQAGFLLACQTAQTLVGVGIIRLMVDHGRAAAAAANDTTAAAPAAKGTTAAAPPQDDLLVYDWRDPFKKPYGWAGWALLGVVLAPVVVGSTALLLDTLGYDKLVRGGQGTVDGVLPILQPNALSYGSLLTVTGLLAPVMEETVFRGFLLPSLTRFMPTWTAVLVTAGFFGVAHLSIRDLPVLFALGSLLGFSYVRSRNLLTPIIIHGTWNSLVLSMLLALSAQGVDMQELMRQAGGAP